MLRSVALKKIDVADLCVENAHMSHILNIVAFTNEPPEMVGKAFRRSALECDRGKSTALGVVFLAGCRW